MKKQYWFIILTYVLMQFSVIIGVPLLYKAGFGGGQVTDENLIQAQGLWSVISFVIGLVIVLLILRTAPKRTLHNEKKAPIGISIMWAIIGIFLALISQMIAGSIEYYILGIGRESENTEAILKIIQSVPLMIAVSSIIGPILEEIIFRKIIFGVLYEKTNFFIAGLISSIIFGIVHADLKHILLYTAMGFTFAFLYARTKRIIVPIFAHIMMNTFVVLMQLEPVQKYLEQQSAQMQLIIGGLFL
ncbi:CPBP family intramembrane glutamic endopeptidase [Bacillus atrophaeus]|uniref:CPBP family intramembrane glutamic endopeptidase n=1 Tax=Bacillus atrophaeus TaxID=1452 RepID=UPI002282D16B|nr:type II CAAX endopeptidase family protein [Bacillus atrophaeus]MCY8826183.1 CPBP family intramembrane metalloprotease [Bacillus atrophaeus]MCY8841564.1 CPBP family intramembrane metalloprotease [Bacillus atrophaeus]MEC0806297.1 type II CAAX endopeptidase family protein [Bacillus atrophaeus]MEC0855118.1 type II CAAX endopeptidase family protein [Bacillus atrophaeus]MEC0858568.1 type II CAAX endopeptidase family protein [Bacillus atrophaeus]